MQRKHVEVESINMILKIGAIKEPILIPVSAFYRFRCFNQTD